MEPQTIENQPTKIANSDTVSHVTASQPLPEIIGTQKKFPWLVVIFATLFVATLIAGTFFFLRMQSLQKQLTMSPSPSATPSSEPSSSPELSASPQVLPTSSPKPVSVKIIDTSSWAKSTCGQAVKVMFKTPVEWKVKCTDNTDGTTEAIITHEGGIMWDAKIQILNYGGGSRRQYWISAIQANENEVAKYIRFQETQFGSVLGLDVFGSSGWWQNGYASPILIANNKTIVLIFGGRDFDDQQNKITRWDMTDAIASTIKFVDD